MKACRAFSLVPGSRTAWVPCARKAERGEKYCQRHGDAVAGALLGEVMYGEESEVESRGNGGVDWKIRDADVE